MKHKLLSTVASLALGLSVGVQAQPTAFTYQGRLTDNGNAATASYDMHFSVFDAASAGNQLGSSVTVAPVSANNGLFTVSLDFGAGVFTGPNRWLEIGVRPNGSAAAYTTLSPRQPLTSSPYSVLAGDVTSQNIARLTVPNTTTSATAVPVVNSGFITSATLMSGGFGYTAVPTVTVNDSTGSGASMTANVSGGVVTSLTVHNPGSGYSGSATITIGAPPSNAYQTFASPTFFNSMVEFNPVSGPAATFGGNVGIGTASPAYRLDVAGQINSSSGFVASSAYTGSYGTVLSVPYYSRTRLLSSYWTAPTGDYIDLEVPGNDGPGNILRMTSHGNLGIGTTSPAARLDIAGSAICRGNLTFSDPASSIQFPAVSGSSSPMMYMFSSGTQNANRMVLAHSPNYPNWGLQYEDDLDKFHFLSSGSAVMTVDLGSRNVGIGTSSPSYKLQVINATCDGNNWNNASDRNLKENFQPVDGREVLSKVVEMPISRWNYKSQSEALHLGPVAQDFHGAFGLGGDDKHIATVDEAGVALAAIQGLNELLKEKDTAICQLQENMARMEEQIHALAQPENRGDR